MKKLFVSLPMNGRPDEEEVLANMQKACVRASEIIGEELELIDQFHKENLPEGAGRCWMLGDSIQKMEQADYIYFAEDWWNGKGTIIEHMIAEMYGISIIYEEGHTFSGYSWAKNETYLAIKDAGDDDEQAKKAFQAALAGFQIFLNKADQNDEKGWDLAVAALRQLTNRLPLTAVTNEPGDWEETDVDEEGKHYFVHKRLGTLFKMVDTEGKEHFVDTERVHCIDIRDTEKKYYHGGMGEIVFNRLVPIMFPYYPNGIYTVYTEEFRCYEDSKEPDTFGVIGFKSPTGEMAEVMQFMKKNPKTGEWDYIQKTEYASRMKKAAALQKKENKPLVDRGFTEEEIDKIKKEEKDGISG